MNKVFCDYCHNEIPPDKVYEVILRYPGEICGTWDACENCFKVIESKLGLKK
jgi:hypothetical protein